MFLLRKFLIFFFAFLYSAVSSSCTQSSYKTEFFYFLDKPSISVHPFRFNTTLSLNNTSFDNLKSLTMAEPGEGPGGARPPYFKTKLKLNCRPPPSPFSNGLYDRPPPLISRSASGTDSGLAVPHWDNSVLRNFLCARNNSNWVPCVISSLIIIYLSFPNEGGGCGVSLRLLTWRR